MLPGTHGIVVTMIVDNVVCITVGTVVSAVTEDTAITELVAVRVVVVLMVVVKVVQVGCASIHMHKVLITLDASAFSCDSRLSRLDVVVAPVFEEVVIVIGREVVDMPRDVTLAEVLLVL